MQTEKHGEKLDWRCRVSLVKVPNSALYDGSQEGLGSVESAPNRDMCEGMIIFRTREPSPNQVEIQDSVREDCNHGCLDIIGTRKQGLGCAPGFEGAKHTPLLVSPFQVHSAKKKRSSKRRVLSSLYSNMFKFFNSFMFDFELTRLLGSTTAGGCDTCEFLTAVSKIKNNNPESWHAAWKEQGERAEAIADEAARNGLNTLAKNGYLRASNYFRAASYLFLNNDPRVVPLSEKSVAAFVRATSFMDSTVLPVDIPYANGISLPAYLYLPQREARLPGKIPLLLYFSGADSTKEELHFLFGYSGPQLGYAVLLLEGPGQGLLLKKSGIHLRPDFEVCADKVLNFLENLDRIAVAGAVTGGYFALRAATDPRVKACVSIDPFFSMFELAMTRVPQAFVQLWKGGWVTDMLFNSTAGLQSWMSFQTRWELGLGMSSMGVKSPAAMLRRFEDFSLDTEKDGRVLDRVACPVLLTGSGGGAEMYSSAANGAMKIHKLLTMVPEADKELWVTVEPADGGLSASIGAWPLLAQKSFRFLDRHFGINRNIVPESKR